MNPFCGKIFIAPRWDRSGAPVSPNPRQQFFTTRQAAAIPAGGRSPGGYPPAQLPCPAGRPTAAAGLDGYPPSRRRQNMAHHRHQRPPAAPGKGHHPQALPLGMAVARAAAAASSVGESGGVGAAPRKAEPPALCSAVSE